MNDYNGFETLMVHSGYETDAATKSVAPPIILPTLMF